jgi:hypothetical protein
MVPGHLAAAGAKNIKVYKSDKCVAFFPPYESPEEKVYIQQMESWFARDFAGWDRDEMKKYFLAGGGDEESFAPLWQQQLDDSRAILQAIKAGTYTAAGGSMQYLIAARK